MKVYDNTKEYAVVRNVENLRQPITVTEITTAVGPIYQVMDTSLRLFGCTLEWAKWAVHYTKLDSTQYTII